jgi:hypothetical protein
MRTLGNQAPESLESCQGCLWRCTDTVMGAIEDARCSKPYAHLAEATRSLLAEYLAKRLWPF